MTPAIYYALLKQSLAAGVPPLGASTSREPTNLPEGTRGEVSTSTAADAAELDALYHGNSTASAAVEVLLHPWFPQEDGLALLKSMHPEMEHLQQDLV